MRWRIGDNVFDKTKRLVSGPVETHLNYRQGRLLEFLIENFGQAYKDRDMIRAVWEGQSAEGSLHKYIAVLRDALGGERKSYIDTDPYRLIVEPKPLDDRSPRDGSATVPVRQARDGVGPAYNSRGLDDPPRSTRSSSPGAHVVTPRAAFDGLVGRSVETGVAPDAWSQWSDFISSASQPSLDALRFADRHNGSDRRIVGAVIELFRHRHLESHSPLQTLEPVS